MLSLAALCLSLSFGSLQAKDNVPVVKTGYSFVPFPMAGFDGAKGILFGALMNVYNFSDGSTYPNPRLPVTQAAARLSSHRSTPAAFFLR